MPNTWKSCLFPTIWGNSLTNTWMPTPVPSNKRLARNSSNAPTPSRTPSRGTWTATACKFYLWSYTNFKVRPLISCDLVHFEKNYVCDRDKKKPTTTQFYLLSIIEDAKQSIFLIHSYFQNRKHYFSKLRVKVSPPVLLTYKLQLIRHYNQSGLWDFFLYNFGDGIPFGDFFVKSTHADKTKLTAITTYF